MATVVLDPGHGGTKVVGGSSPNNAKGPGGTLEKTVTLKVARAARSALAAAGMNVLLTRDSDVNLGLADRAAVAKKAKAEVFVSIHFNGFNNKAQGTETWVWPEASSASRALAKKMQARLLQATGLKDRGILDYKSLGVLDPSSHAAVTAVVLVEISFMDVAAEEKRLADQAYIDSIGEAIAAAAIAHVKSLGGFNEALSGAEVFEDGLSARMAATEERADLDDDVLEEDEEAPVLEGVERADGWHEVRDDLQALVDRMTNLLAGAPGLAGRAWRGHREAAAELEAVDRYAFVHDGLSKMQFLDRNRRELDRLLSDVNAVLSRHYGQEAQHISFLEAAVLLNCEAGLKSGGLVDPEYEHSEGERGLLPLPSKLRDWNSFAGPVPDPNEPMPLATNIWHFMLYLGQLKNKPILRTPSRLLFRDLFRHEGIAGVPEREARLLAGIVHGYFTKSNYSAGGIPFDHILRGYASDVSLPALMQPTKYRHAGKKLMVDRHKNIEAAVDRF